MKTNTRTLSCFGAIVTTVHGSFCRHRPQNSKWTGNKFGPGFLLDACSFGGRGLETLGFASPRSGHLPLGGGVVHLFRIQISLAFSEGFECLGSWCLRPPGVMSCLPSEGAGSGARPHLLSVPELCRYLAESWLTFQIHLQELLQYKRQNPAQVSSTS